MKVALTGASGFVASHLREKFNDYVVIQRADSEDEILKKLQDVDIVFNLAGAPIIKRWSKSYKSLLVSSRIDGTIKLVNAINRSNVKHFISTSAIGAYPDDNVYDEGFDAYADDFLGQLTKEWEQEAKKCIKPTAIVRFGVILGRDGGALAQMLTPFKVGLGGILGDGKMMTSWIDIDDLVSAYRYILENKLTGVFNATSPNPVSNYEFTKALGKFLHRPTIIPMPKFVLKLIFGEASTVLTSSKEVYPKALGDAGFTFKYKTIQESLSHLLKRL